MVREGQAEQPAQSVDADRIRAKVGVVGRTWLTPGEAEHLAEIRREQCDVIAAAIRTQAGPLTADRLAELVTLPINIVTKRCRERPDLFVERGGAWKLC